MALLRIYCLPPAVFAGIKLYKLKSLPTAATFLCPLLAVGLGRKLFILML